MAKRAAAEDRWCKGPRRTKRTPMQQLQDAHNETVFKKLKKKQLAENQKDHVRTVRDAMRKTAQILDGPLYNLLRQELACAGVAGEESQFLADTAEAVIDQSELRALAETWTYKKYLQAVRRSRREIAKEVRTLRRDVTKLNKIIDQLVELIGEDDSAFQPID